MNQTAKRARKVRLQRVFDQADAAERSKDHFRLYQAVRSLAPKQKLQRIQLRHADGTLASPTQAADMLQQWYEALYNAPASDHDPDPFNWPFTDDELLHGFLKVTYDEIFGTNICSCTSMAHGSSSCCTISTTTFS